MQELLEILNSISFRKTLVMRLVTTGYRVVVSLTGGLNTNTIASGVFILHDLAWVVVLWKAVLCSGCGLGAV